MKFIWCASGCDVGNCDVIKCCREFEIHCSSSRLEQLMEEWRSCVADDSGEAIPRLPDIAKLKATFFHTAAPLREHMFWHLFIPK